MNPGCDPAVGVEIEVTVPGSFSTDCEFLAVRLELNTARGRRHPFDAIDCPVCFLVHVPPQDAPDIVMPNNIFSQLITVAQSLLINP